MAIPTRCNTPIEEVQCGRKTVFVKREDLSSPYPGPPFSKMRGVFQHIVNRPEKAIGVLDTIHSQGGWAVAYACQLLGRKAVVFYPQGKDEVELRPYQQTAQRLGAHLQALKPGRSAILYHQAVADLAKCSDSYMMPNALKLPETIAETAKEVLTVPAAFKRGTWVVSASSATIASGVLAGLGRLGWAPRVIVHLGYSRPSSAVRRYVFAMAGASIMEPLPKYEIVDEGYTYRDQIADPKLTPVFPCNPYYDRKAWAWISQQTGLKAPILFWNIG